MKQVSQYSKFNKTMKYILDENKGLSVLFAFGLLISIAIAYWYKVDVFDTWVDPVASVMTLLVAISIAIMNYSKTWKAVLPKTLTVHFKYDGKYYLSCYYADLTSEGDIRNWAQQIGSQMTQGALLDFNPFFDLDAQGVIQLEPHGIDVMHYQLTILLKSPSNIRSRESSDAFDTTKYKRWFVSHDKEHKFDYLIELEPIPPTDELIHISEKEILISQSK